MGSERWALLNKKREMAAAVGRQWNSLMIARRRNNVLLVVARPKSVPVRSSTAAAARTATAATATPAVVVSLAAAGAPPCTVVASQHSNARIEKSNRRSRFGEPLATTDCEEDDDDLCKVLSAEIQSVEREGLEDVAGRNSYRKGKKVTRTGTKRLDNMASPKVIITQAEKGGASRAPDMKQLVRADGFNSVRVKPRAAGMKIKSSMAHKLRVPPVGDKFLTSVGDEFLTRKDWEEQAYQIIRKQKLRNVALARARVIAVTPKGLVETPASTTKASGTVHASLQYVTTLTADAPGMEDAEISCVSKRLGLEDKCRPLLEYLHCLGVRERDFIRIIERHKACLQANVNVVKERVEFLITLGVRFQHLPKLIVRHPQILEYRVEQAMKPRVRYLKSLGLDDSKIGKIITVSPSLLECSLERSIKPRVTYLVKTVGIKSQDIGKIVMWSPQILTQSIEESLEPRLDFFLNELKLSKEALAKMVTRHPQLLHYSVEDGVRPRVKYLRSIGMNDDDVIKVLTRLTQILSLSVENCLKPKYNYLVTELKGGVQTVTSFPAYFSLSLDERIVPRHRYLQYLETNPQRPFPMRLLTISDIAFCERAKSTLEAYDKFRHDRRLSSFVKKFEWKNNVQI